MVEPAGRYAGLMKNLSRRALAQIAPLALVIPHSLKSQTLTDAPSSGGWPVQSPELAREMVTVAHGNLKRTRELVEARPSLANAAIDWGFGDWETALGGASHVGNREIAEFLIANGARPTLFSAAMLGHLDVVRAMIIAQPGAQKIRGPHSISLLSHARAGGVKAEPVFRYLESLGDAGSPPPVPVGDADRQAIIGVWTYGSGPNQTVEIKEDRNALTFVRTGVASRNLNHLGNLEFFPAGGNAVRIRFSKAATGMVLTVHDPDVVMRAEKK